MGRNFLLLLSLLHNHRWPGGLCGRNLAWVSLSLGETGLRIGGWEVVLFSLLVEEDSTTGQFIAGQARKDRPR